MSGKTLIYVSYMLCKNMKRMFYKNKNELEIQLGIWELVGYRLEQKIKIIKGYDF